MRFVALLSENVSSDPSKGYSKLTIPNSVLDLGEHRQTKGPCRDKTGKVREREKIGGRVSSMRWEIPQFFALFKVVANKTCFKYMTTSLIGFS